ncbi:MAG: hypothetical protein ACYCZW_01470 [Minisyncoccota bacterium]
MIVDPIVQKMVFEAQAYEQKRNHGNETGAHREDDELHLFLPQDRNQTK